MHSISRHPEQLPVFVRFEGCTLIIDCLFRFNRRANREKPDPERNETYADLIIAGISQNWRSSHAYRDVLPDNIQSDRADAATGDKLSIESDRTDVATGDRLSIESHRTDTATGDRLSIEVRIERIDWRQRLQEIKTALRSGWRQGLTAWFSRRHSVKISVRPMLFMPAHVISPLYRRFWGILRTGQLESLGLNWSPRHPGRIIMPPYRQVWMVKSVAAHEAGHIFGIGDAYAAIYRFYHEAPGTNGYMMNSNQSVHADEIKMMLKAHQTGRMQFFPRRWNTRLFFAGLAGDVRQRSRQIQIRLSDNRNARLSGNRKTRL